MSIESEYLARQPMTAERVRSWGEADAYLGAKSDRPLANNTRLQRRDSGDIAVRLHATDVVTFHPNGDASLNTGGWFTVTTKDRVNTFASAYGIRVWSERGRWNIYGRGNGSPSPVLSRFFDGVRLRHPIAADNGQARILNPLPADDVANLELSERTMMARIRTYVAGYVGKLREGMPAPNGGDCWYCLMFDSQAPKDDGPSVTGWRAADDGAGKVPIPGRTDADHLLSHLGGTDEESDPYYVPSLAVNALRYVGMRDMGIGMVLRMDGETLGGTHAWGGPDYSTVSRALTRYLKARLVPSLGR